MELNEKWKLTTQNNAYLWEGNQISKQNRYPWWAQGMDYLPWEPPIARHFSPWLKTIYGGDYQGFLKMLENKSEEEVRNMLKKRETMLNVNAIFHCIIGTSR